MNESIHTCNPWASHGSSYHHPNGFFFICILLWSYNVNSGFFRAIIEWPTYTDIFHLKTRFSLVLYAIRSFGLGMRTRKIRALLLFIVFIAFRRGWMSDGLEYAVHSMIIICLYILVHDRECLLVWSERAEWLERHFVFFYRYIEASGLLFLFLYLLLLFTIDRRNSHNIGMNCS